MPTAIEISPRGTLTLPIGVRRRLRLNPKQHSLLLIEERPDGIFLHPAIPVAVRDLPADKINQWVQEDDAAAASVRLKR